MECIPQLTLYNTFITFCFTIIFILSLLGNWAAVLAISKHEQRSAPRSITNVFLLNLAIADLLRNRSVKINDLHTANIVKRNITLLVAGTIRL